MGIWAFAAFFLKDIIKFLFSQDGHLYKCPCSKCHWEQRFVGIRGHLCCAQWEKRTWTSSKPHSCRLGRMLWPMGRAFEQMQPLEACLDSIFVHCSEILLSISSLRASFAERFYLKKKKSLQLKTPSSKSKLKSVLDESARSCPGSNSNLFE